jgi:hypothetical protein
VQDWQGDSNFPAPVTMETIRAMQSAIEYAIVQNQPVSTLHLLFGIAMINESAAAIVLSRHGITIETVLDEMPNYLPNEDPPF